MAGLGILLYGALRAAVGIGKACENTWFMSHPYRYTEDGTPVYMDRDYNSYINGEKIVTKLEKKPDGRLYSVKVGECSGKVYNDPYQREIDKKKERYRKTRQTAIDEGKFVYMFYDQDRLQWLLIEIATDKAVARIEGREDGTYWKYYAKPPRSKLDIVQPEDTPIQITQEEYDKMNYSIIRTGDYNREYLAIQRDGSVKWTLRDEPMVAKEDLPPVPGRN